tara:strand:+ start:465 stop:1241 length:777 start_codon:yes stop_codon:yes gene_type:complete
MSIFYQDLKAVILLSGIFFTIYILKQVTEGTSSNDDNQFIIYCSMFNTLETPGTSTAVISFMFMYMLLPMIYNNEYNALVLTTISLLWILDIYHKLFQYACFDTSVAFIATLIGLSCSSGYFFTIYNLGEEYYNFLYFNVSKNNLVQCNKNDETEYVCEFEEEEKTNNSVTGYVANGLTRNVTMTSGQPIDGSDAHEAGVQINNVKSELETINQKINSLLNYDYAATQNTGGVHYHYDQTNDNPIKASSHDPEHIESI